MSMSDAEEARYRDICLGYAQPDEAAYRRGIADHAIGKAFHEGPKPHFTVEGLSWRLGWNARALVTN